MLFLRTYSCSLDTVYGNITDIQQLEFSWDRLLVAEIMAELDNDTDREMNYYYY